MTLDEDTNASTSTNCDTKLQDLALAIFDTIRDIKDPERPENLYELGVIQEDDITVTEHTGVLYIEVRFTPTVPHCHLATLIGLCIRVKVSRFLTERHKVFPDEKYLSNLFTT